ncbi:MAG: hypothetical protein Q9163_006473 [Psora crenata]
MSSPPPPPSVAPSPKTSDTGLGSHSLPAEELSGDCGTSSGLPAPTVSFSTPDPSATVTASALHHPPRGGSVQFADTSNRSAEFTSPSISTTTAAKTRGRIASPPPPSTYKPRITFDLFANQSTTDPSFTLISQHKHYARRKGSRTYLCGTDESDYAAFALEYLIDKLVDDGDDIVCVRVMDKDSEVASDLGAQDAEYKMKARQVREQVQLLLDGEDRPAVKVVIEFAVGKVGETIDRMVNLHSPISVVVGTRGKSLAGSSFGKGSVSQYLYQHSPVPVIIVRPHDVRLKHLRKRQDNPNRPGYLNVVQKAKDGGVGSLNVATTSPVLEASEDESEAVAKAIGLPQGYAKLRDSNQPSGSRNNSKERPRIIVTEPFDADGGTPPSTVSNSKGITDPDDHPAYTLRGGSSFEEMPNYIPGLGHSSDVEDVYEVAGDAEI